MMKQTLHALGALTIAAALTMLSTACTNDDSLLADEPQASAVKTYTVSIPATMAGDETRAVSIDGTTITRSFNENERVYVYNVTKNGLMDGYLQPTNISADGKSCTLTGELSDYAIEANDELKLLYNLNNVDTEKENDLYKDYTYFDYGGQNGTQAGVLDGAVATVTASNYTDGTLTTTAASFQPAQSIFRFQFVDGNNNLLNVKTLTVDFSTSGAARQYHPLKSTPYSSSIACFSMLTPGTHDYYVAMAIDEENAQNAELTFTAITSDRKMYRGTRTAPTGGFKNGKYYYNSSPIVLQEQPNTTPTFEWIAATESSKTPENGNEYDVRGPLQNGVYTPSEFALSGISNGYYFFLSSSSTIHLNDFTALWSGAGNPGVFIYGSRDLHLIVNGSNSVTVRSTDPWYAISTDSHYSVKLSGNGTLAITCGNRSGLAFGINGGNYGRYGSSNEPSALAYDEKTTVTREMVDNGDGTYTWTYTVKTTK